MQLVPAGFHRVVAAQLLLPPRSAYVTTSPRMQRCRRRSSLPCCVTDTSELICQPFCARSCRRCGASTKVKHRAPSLPPSVCGM